MGGVVAPVAYLLVTLGGSIGAYFRFLMVNKLGKLTLASSFPYGILSVNIFGSMLMGVVIALMARYGSGNYTVMVGYLFFGIGVLGGFTTFSSFALDTAYMLQRGDIKLAAFYTVISVVGSIGALFLAMIITRKIVLPG